MTSTLFCLVLPGDSASARRTSEIFMAGCIPVFLGPPYGSMPLAERGGIDYKASSLFFNVSEYRWANHWEDQLYVASFYIAILPCCCYCTFRMMTGIFRHNTRFGSVGISVTSKACSLQSQVKSLLCARRQTAYGMVA